MYISSQWSDGSAGSLFYTAGNIGIGSSTPTYLLDVAGNLRATSGDITLGSLLATNISNTALTSGSIRVNTLISSANITASLITGANALVTNISNTNITSSTILASTLVSSANIAFGVITGGTALISNINSTNITSNTIFITNGSLSATWNSNTIGNIITTGGNVGIATSVPNFTLDINGTFDVSNVNGTMVFASSGNVGINTTTPSYKLDVAGNLRATSGDITLGSLLATNISNTALTSGTIRASTLIDSPNISNMALTSGTIRASTLISSANIAVNIITGGTALITNISNTALTSGTILASTLISSANITANLITGGTALVTNISNTSLTSGTIRATTLISSANLSTGIITAANLLNTNLSSSNVTVSGTISTANLRSNLVVVGDTSVEFSGSFAASNNVTSASDITGISFSTSQIRSFTVTLAITISKATPNLFSQVVIEGVQKTTGWDLFTSEMGDDTGILFTMTTAGQLQYTSPNFVSWVSTTFRWNAKAINITGSYTPIVLPTSGTQTISGPLNITSNTNATNASSGALTVAGGAGIARDLIVGGTIFGTIWTTSVQNGSFSATASHKNYLFLVSGTSTISLLPATTAGVNFIIGFQKTDSINTQIDIIPSSTTIEDNSNYVLSTKNETVILISDGSNWRIMSTKTSVLATVFSVPGTYTFTVPNPIRTVYACVFGAGGGGASGAGNSGNGGGGGGYCEGTISVSPGDTLTITVGAGGASGIAGESSYVNDIVATGGGAGGTNSSGVWGSNGTAGVGTGGIVNRNGGTGGQAPSQTSGSGGGGGGAGNNGDGVAGSGIIGGAGSSGYGGVSTTSVTTDGSSLRVLCNFREGGSGASGNIEGTTTNGNDGGFPGGGGSGGGGFGLGGNGADGAVIIFY